MLVTLIGKNKIYRLRLPETVEGEYWIYSNPNDDNSKLVSICAYKGQWIVSSSKYSKVINPKAVRNKKGIYKIIPLNNTIVKAARLRIYGKAFISLKNDDLYILYVLPSYEENKTIYKMLSDEISIGTTDDCDIRIENKFIDGQNAKIYRRNGRFYVESNNPQFGVFVNDEIIDDDSTLINNGDTLFILGYKVMCLGKDIYIYGPKDNFSVYQRKLVQIQIKEDIEEETIEDEPIEDFELYQENEYFYRSPRIVEMIEPEDVVIDKPPDRKERSTTMQIVMLLSSFGMSIMTMVTLFNTIGKVASGQATFSAVAHSFFISMVMLAMTLSLPIIRIAVMKKSDKKKERIRQTEYKKYINTNIMQINSIMEKQSKILRDTYPSAEQCERVILERAPKLWERKNEDFDFLAVNLGNGKKSLEINLSKEKRGFMMYPDNLMDIYYDVSNKSRILENVPITTSLAEKNIAAIIGKNCKVTSEYMKSLVLQLIALHSYVDLKLVFFVKNENEWEYVKLLPHVWDDERITRFFASKRDDIKEISGYLEEIISERLSMDGESPYSARKKINYKNFDTYYLIITDNYKNMHNVPIINRILSCGENAGFGLLCITDDITQLPNKCMEFIEINGDKGKVYENRASSTSKKEVSIEKFEEFNYEEIAKTLSNIPIKSSSAKATSLPDHYNFLEMYKVGKIEQLNIYDRWSNTDSTVSLQAQIGIDSSGNAIYLDAHEKYHGPHGLIAGTTGSGKSEFIITYILSLAINYHPDDVTFVLIDYKGGGLTGAFKKEKIQLPHLVGTITNIDQVGLQRSLESIESELKRRQIKFNEAKEITNESTIDIYKYQKFYHKGVLKEPISHLFIICDEFAELKQQQPEFMAELMSVSRIGRSLGVHLILATQKPSGIVNEQIRSNSKFGICLKVQSKSDSKDIIKRPDGATLKKAGQFYINVGNDEYYALGQSGYTGTPYIPSDDVKKNLDDSVEFISNTGGSIKRIETRIENDSSELKKNGDQLTNIVKYLSDLAQRKDIHEQSLWLDQIPEDIYINQLRKKYNVKTEKNIINPIIGEYDNPQKQLQGVLTLNLSEDGNTIIFGSTDSGKELVFQAVLYDSMLKHTSEEVHFYLIDYGNETLNMFKGAPCVGDVMTAEDKEKIVRLFKMIRKEIKIRKEKLLPYNGDYQLFIKSSRENMPMIVIMINEYFNYMQAFPKEEENMNRMFKEAVGLGIVFIISVSATNEIRTRTTQNFKKKISLQLISNEYASVFPKARRKRPSSIYGRGLCTIDDDNVYEFQTAKMFNSDNVNESLNEFIEKLNERDKIKVEPIAIVPKFISIDDIKEQIKGINNLPIGITTNDIVPYKFNFRKNVVNIITANDMDRALKFVTPLIQELKMIENTSVILYDEEELIIKSPVDFVGRFNAMTERINNNYAQKEDKQIIYVIFGIGKFIEKLGREKERFTSNVKGGFLSENCRFIIVDVATKIRSLQQETWFKKYANAKDGIYIGEGFDIQGALLSSMDRKNIVTKCADSFGYVVDNRKATFVKLVGIKDEEETDE